MTGEGNTTRNTGEYASEVRNRVTDSSVFGSTEK
jgi:hypothetical protein